jgi:hypothetical protein
MEVSMKLLSGCLVALVIGCVSTTSTTGSGMAHVDVRLTDAPATFDSVFVTISKIEVSTADDSWVTLSTQPQRFDLLALQNDATALLGGADLAAGTYNQLRLVVDSSSVVVGGVETPLTIASGAQTGIKINLDTDITADTKYTLVLDYDASKSVKSTGAGYLMTPVIKVKSFTGTPTETQPGSGSGSG